jgi:hypothetical protein
MIDCLAGQLRLDREDLRLHLVLELTITAFTVSGRHWVHGGGQGGRAALLDDFDEAIRAIPASLELSADPDAGHRGGQVSPGQSTRTSTSREAMPLATTRRS